MKAATHVNFVYKLRIHSSQMSFECHGSAFMSVPVVWKSCAKSIYTSLIDNCRLPNFCNKVYVCVKALRSTTPCFLILNIFHRLSFEIRTQPALIAHWLLF